MARARFQMPSVRRRKWTKKNGEPGKEYWYIQFYDDRLIDGRVARKRPTKNLGYCPTTNDPKQRIYRGEITIREAERLRNEFMHAVNNPGASVKTQTPFRDFAERWLQQHVPTLRRTTQVKYASQLRLHLLPAFGHLRLCDIDTENVQAWLLGVPLGWAAKKDLKGTLSSIFSTADTWGYWTERNPVKGVSVGQGRYKREKRLLTDEQVDALLAEVVKEPNPNPQRARLVAIMIELCLTTGCRISEVLGLQERHVSADWIAIRQSWDGKEVAPTKTRTSERDCPLGKLAPRIRALLTGQPEKFLFAPLGEEPPRAQMLLTVHVTPAMRRLGIWSEGLGWHAFRRMFGTNIQAKGGMTSIEAADLLGHSDVRQTQDYTVVQRGRKQRGVERMQGGSVVEFPESEVG